MVGKIKRWFPIIVDFCDDSKLTNFSQRMEIKEGKVMIKVWGKWESKIFLQVASKNSPSMLFIYSCLLLFDIHS